MNRILKTLAEKAAHWTYRRPSLKKMGARWPFLRRLAHIPELLFDGQQWLVVCFYGLFLLSLLRLFFFPYVFYISYWYELQHGLSNYTLGLWLVDYVKSFFISTILSTTMVFGIYGLLRRVGSRWWILLWAGVSLAFFGYLLVAPYMDHIYSDFRSLERGQLRTELLTLAENQGAQVEDILVVDASRRTKKVNAYVKGTGATQRIVLYDTLLEEFTSREICMVLAHELVHWKDPHKKRDYLLFSIIVFVVLYLANRVLEGGTRFPFLHYSSPRDVAGLPILFLTFFLIFQILSPVSLHWKRGHELETDRKSLEMICDPEAFSQVHVKLARLNHQDVKPHPLVVLLFFSHPPFTERIQVALQATCPGDSLLEKSSVESPSGYGPEGEKP